MKVVESSLIGKVYDFDFLRYALEKEGFIMGETFTYKYVAFDYPLYKSKIEYDYYLRIFADAVKSYIEKPDCQVQINDIEIFKAKYHNGIFREHEVPAEYVKKAEAVLKKVHEALGEPAQFTIKDAESVQKA